MGDVPLVSQTERSPSARGTEALQSCFCRPGLHSMTTGSRESSRSTSRRRGTRLLPLPCHIQGGERCRPGCRARGAFVLSKRAAQDARVLRADELRPRRIEGASFSQIRCRQGRSVRRGCSRVAPPKTAARTAAPAAQSLLPCSLLSTIAGIGRHWSDKKILPLSKCPRTVRRSRSASRRAPFTAAPVALRAASAAATAK